ncbi:ankyrin repeat domain-containing protein SOWAHA [Genypterus blacodes]|uniref:ankyrin repeat domain-containing protein SOWAHA n=1 Tax=Genypterus blacodes TaxID=154954 RepID=UPI003F75D32B
MALTQDAILSFLLDRGGKVRNAELLSHFRGHISSGDPAEKQHKRDLFKKLVNGVAVVKHIDETKFVVVRKKYRDSIQGAAGDAEDAIGSLNATFSSSTSSPGAERDHRLYSDFENNNNLCCTPNLNDCYPRKSDEDTTALKVVNICREASRSRKSGAVFAVVAVKSPSHPQRRSVSGTTHIPQHEASHKPDTVGTRGSTTPSVPNLNVYSQESVLSVSQCGTTRQTGEIPSSQSFTHLKKFQNKNTRLGDEAKDSESVPLEPLAHEWLVKCAAGQWGQIYALLLRDSQLVKKKDFISGFTALHWAAKDGNTDMVHKIINISGKRGVYVDVNSKAHGGYTPLHLAAIHSHAQVMLVLVQRYGADINLRDNGGKKPNRYLGEAVSAEVRGLLGGRQQGRAKGEEEEEEEEEEGREQHRGFNTISKLFQPHKKHKAATKCVHDW